MSALCGVTPHLYLHVNINVLKLQRSGFWVIPPKVPDIMHLNSFTRILTISLLRLSLENREHNAGVSVLQEPHRGCGAQLWIPAHPHAGLAGVCGGQLDGRLPAGSFCRQHLCCLAADVVVQLDELVQVHDAWRFHRPSLLVDLGKHDFISKNITYPANITN